MFVALVKVPLKLSIIPYAWIYYNITVPNGLDKYAPVLNISFFTGAKVQILTPERLRG